jgi:hypothetical protein
LWIFGLIAIAVGSIFRNLLQIQSLKKRVFGETLNFA